MGRQGTSENLATMQADANNSSMVLQESPNIFQANIQIAEPMTVPGEDQIRINDATSIEREARDLNVEIEM